MAPKEVAKALDRRHDIVTRPGMHEAAEANKNLGTFPDGALRISPGPFTTPEEIGSLLGALREIHANGA